VADAGRDLAVDVEFLKAFHDLAAVAGLVIDADDGRSSAFN